MAEHRGAIGFEEHGLAHGRASDAMMARRI